MIPTDEIEQYPRPRFRRFFLLPVAIVIGGASLFAALQPAEAPEPDGPRPAPEFSLPLVGGGTLTSEELHGSPVVLNMWASWCGPCREEAPALERLWKAHRGHGLQIIGVNTRDTDEAARGFIKKYGVTYPVVTDADQELVAQLEEISGLRDALPQTFFVGSDGNFLASDSGEEVATEGTTAVLGAISEEELEAHIQKLLAGPPPQP